MVIWLYFHRLGKFWKKNLATLVRSSFLVCRGEKSFVSMLTPNVGINLKGEKNKCKAFSYFAKWQTSVARWYIFRPKITIWVHF
jgi:hypothetical protein